MFYDVFQQVQRAHVACIQYPKLNFMFHEKQLHAAAENQVAESGEREPQQQIWDVKPQWAEIRLINIDKYSFKNRSWVNVPTVFQPYTV